MIGNRHEMPQFQSDFYRNNYHKILRWLFTSILVMLLLILGIIYLELFAPTTKFYASTTSGQIVELKAYGR